MANVAVTVQIDESRVAKLQKHAKACGLQFESLVRDAIDNGIDKTITSTTEADAKVRTTAKK